MVAWWGEDALRTTKPPMTLQAPLNILVRLVQMMSQKGSSATFTEVPMVSSTTSTKRYLCDSS